MTSGKEATPPPPRAEPKAATDPTKADEALAAKVHALEEERDRLKAELADARDKFLRARADYENLVRRTQKDSAESVRNAKGSMLLRVAAVAETLEKAATDASRVGPEAAKGLRLVLEDLRRLLKDEHVKEIETVGQMFNYRYHQAVESVETPDHPEGAILEVVQRGYLLSGDILRPALVRVATPPKRTAPREGTSEPRKTAGAA